jgi:hypothetical protein
MCGSLCSDGLCAVAVTAEVLQTAERGERNKVLPAQQMICRCHRMPRHVPNVDLFGPDLDLDLDLELIAIDKRLYLCVSSSMFYLAAADAGISLVRWHCLI